MSKIKDLLKDDKPREQAKSLGIESLTNYSLLALIISSGVRGISCLDIANDILKKAENVRNLVNLTYYDLVQIKGLSDAKIFRLLASFELLKRINNEINSKLSLEEYNPKLIADEFIVQVKESEKLFIVAYKNKYRVKILRFSSYSNDFIRFSLNSLIKNLKEYGANNIILIHSHDEEIVPSNDDIFTTFYLLDSFKNESIDLIDHIILSKNDYYSFKENKVI